LRVQVQPVLIPVKKMVKKAGHHFGNALIHEYSKMAISLRVSTPAGLKPSTREYKRGMYYYTIDLLFD
jgi:hypothetical protein